MKNTLQQYLQNDEIIDWQHPKVLTKAKQLAGNSQSEIDIARQCFSYVRDEIQHSGDSQRNESSCSASEVLHIGTGWCYAKSHLLAALLRANGLAAGLCYQRLTIDGDTGPHCLHGLNAVYLQQYGWYRIDARGNKATVNAAFTPPTEQLAFPIQHIGEADINGIFAEPLPVVVTALRQHKRHQTMLCHLPDIELW